MTSTDQLKTTDENKRIDSLSGDADWYDKFMPLALFNLRYTFAESGRQVYFGTPPELSGPPVNLAIVYSATGRDEEAVAALAEVLAKGRRARCAILDLTVPGGMGGRSCGTSA